MKIYNIYNIRITKIHSNDKIVLKVTEINKRVRLVFKNTKY